MLGSARRTAGRPQKRTHETMRYPAPIRGIDNRLSLGSGDINHCVYAYNLVPNEEGMRVREGYREWEIGVDAGSGEGVHTLIPFNTSDSAAADKLFAVNNEGIWEVTDYDTAPNQVATFSNQAADAGYGTFTRYVTQAEVDVLFYADNLNGLWEYTVSTDTWAVPTGITGITESEINFVISYKNNVWFGIRDSTVGYWLPLLANAGAVTPQYFGDKFRLGGALKGLFSWSVDGGDGVDDILIAVSSSGDVVVYTGSGPDQDDWGMKGVYYIGDIPNTPRFGSEQGGELYLLCSYGIVSMNDLLQGVDTTAIMSDTEGSSMSVKIAKSLRRKMKTSLNERGWDVAIIPSQGGILVSTPQVGSELAEQFYYNIATKGWGVWRGVPMECFANYGGFVYLGTADGRIMVMDSPVDNALITPTAPPINGDDIEFSILTMYSNMGLDGIYKRVHLIRPDFISSLAPSHSSQMRWDFDTLEGVNTSLEAPVANTSDVWDTGVFETAIWGSDSGVVFPSIGGAWGRGRYGAVATRGTCRTDTNLVGWDVIYSAGGPMW